MIYGYIRVSTDKQTVENQRFEISRFCEKEGIVIDCWVEETVSGTKEPEKRKLGKFLKRIHKGDIIGSVGSTGNTNGPHLHYTITKDGVPQDPEKFINY